MPFAPYADTAALNAWLGTAPAPDNPIVLLRSATFVVAAAANRNPYTDSPDIAARAALADATCAQVQAWATSGVSPADPSGGRGLLKERALDTARFVYDTTGAAAARLKLAEQIAPEAERILYTAGLLALELPVGTAANDTLARYGLARPLGGIGFDPYGWEAVADAGHWYRYDLFG